MRRLQLVEIEDLPWFPSVIRDGGTACLRAIGRMGRMGSHAVPALADALRRTGHTRIIDLCSGGAGPLPEILRGLASEGLEVRAVMTDLYPNREALARIAGDSGGLAEFRPDPVDAANVPDDLRGFRLILNGFHHFPPGVARGILADAVRKRVPIAVFEVVERTPWAVLGVVLSPFVAMGLMPWIRPVRLSWWLLVFALPLIPAMLLVDGLVSCFRVYSPAELRELIDGIEGHEDFDWSFDRRWMWPLPMRAQIMTGTPKATGTEAAP